MKRWISLSEFLIHEKEDVPIYFLLPGFPFSNDIICSTQWRTQYIASVESGASHIEEKGTARYKKTQIKYDYIDRFWSFSYFFFNDEKKKHEVKVLRIFLLRSHQIERGWIICGAFNKKLNVNNREYNLQMKSTDDFFNFARRFNMVSTFFVLKRYLLFHNSEHEWIKHRKKLFNLDIISIFRFWTFEVLNFPMEFSVRRLSINSKIIKEKEGQTPWMTEWRHKKKKKINEFRFNYFSSIRKLIKSCCFLSLSNLITFECNLMYAQCSLLTAFWTDWERKEKKKCNFIPGVK